jgi:hypothetical protein
VVLGKLMSGLGGISHLSKRYGWGCDNVRNYEVVLANSSISNINLESNPDLYWALRGGGNNFGIVTRFDLEVHPQVPMWGGWDLLLLSGVQDQMAELGIPRPFTWSLNWALESTIEIVNRLACRLGYCTTIDHVADIMERLSTEAESDPDAQAYMVFMFVPYVHSYGMALQMTHAGALKNAPSFKELQRLKPVYSTNRLAFNSDFAREIMENNPKGPR